jgi:hypothetical protein
MATRRPSRQFGNDDSGEKLSILCPGLLCFSLQATK